MSAHFPTVKGRAYGYDIVQVDAVIAAARKQFADPSLHEVSAAGIRNSEFKLVQGGYSIQAVDEALLRLDDAFAAQEIRRLLAQTGHHGLEEKARHLAELIDGRNARKRGHRYRRVGRLLRGYSPRQVDAFVQATSSALEIASLSADFDKIVEDLRAKKFSVVWGGYAEEQVDAALDRLVQLAQIRAAI